MIHWMREGQLRKPGLNIYHPSEWKYSRGFEIRTTNRVWRIRWSVKLGKFIRNSSCRS